MFRHFLYLKNNKPFDLTINNNIFAKIAEQTDINLHTMGLITNRKKRTRTDEERFYDNLAEQIFKGNVIPVIGDSLVLENEDTTIAKALLEAIATDYEISCNPETFSDLYYDKEFEEYRTRLYEDVSGFIEANQENFKPSAILQDLLSIKQFPFVITTSVDYTVEETMKEIWLKRGKEVKSLIFCNDPKKNDDIKSDTEIKHPTIYYIFGKANNNREHSFVLTEEDLLLFCKSHLSDMEGAHLPKVIAEKYLLFIGVNYSDWLMRFIWYSIRSKLYNKSDEATKNQQSDVFTEKNKSDVFIDNQHMETSLLNFLKRISIKIQNNPKTVLDEIKSRLKKLEDREKEDEEKKFDTVPQHSDFFISYSRRDIQYAAELYKELTERGYKCWYDKKNISIGEDWELAIRKGICTARKCIILLSENIANESQSHHPYRTEWDIALAHRASDIDFVSPICIGDADIYKDEGMKLPYDLKAINARQWKKSDDLKEIIDSLTSALP